MVDKLIKVQGQLKAPKGQHNSFGNYNYRSCEDILEAVKPLCTSAGLLLTLSDEVIEVGGRVYVKATAEVSDGTKSHSVAAYAREQESKKGMDAAQITGSASSYARKYALNGLFCIDDTKDADTDEQKLQGRNQTGATAEQLDALKGHAVTLEASGDKRAGWLNGQISSGLTYDRAVDILAKLEA